MDRSAYSSERLAEEDHKHNDPEFYKDLKALGYTHQRDEVQAVITLTTQAATMAMNDMMARLNNFRVENNDKYDMQEFSFTHGYYQHEAFPHDNYAMRMFVASGDEHRRF